MLLPLKNNEEVVESLYERILGRTAVHDVYHPLTGELIVTAGDEINEEIARMIEDSPIEHSGNPFGTYLRIEKGCLCQMLWT